MQKHRQMPGMTYRIVSQNVNQAILECTYLCPYCMRQSTVRTVIYPADYERLETWKRVDSMMLLIAANAGKLRMSGSGTT